MWRIEQKMQKTPHILNPSICIYNLTEVHKGYRCNAVLGKEDCLNKGSIGVVLRTSLLVQHHHRVDASLSALQTQDGQIKNQRTRF